MAPDCRVSTFSFDASWRDDWLDDDVSCRCDWLDDVVEDAATAVLYALAKTEFINEAAELAGIVALSVGKRVDIPNRGVKQADFYVLRGANMPAMLIEMGYLTNARDEAKLQSEKYRSKMIEGICAGIISYAERKGWRAGGAR